MKVSILSFRKALTELMKEYYDEMRNLHSTKRYRRTPVMKKRVSNSKYYITIDAPMITFSHNGKFIGYIYLDDDFTSSNGEKLYLNHALDRLLCTNRK